MLSQSAIPHSRHAWTRASILHNLIMFVVLHLEKGTPFETNDQGRSRFLIAWEQIDRGTQFAAPRKFLTVVSIVLFFLASFYTKHHALCRPIPLCRQYCVALVGPAAQTAHVPQNAHIWHQQVLSLSGVLRRDK